MYSPLLHLFATDIESYRSRICATYLNEWEWERGLVWREEEGKRNGWWAGGSTDRYEEEEGGWTGGVGRSLADHCCQPSRVERSRARNPQEPCDRRSLRGSYNGRSINNIATTMDLRLRSQWRLA